MAASADADRAEKEAFQKMHKLLGKPEVLFNPAGASYNFPDFGYRIPLDNKKIDVFIEYKKNDHAQMGSMRDWVFDGNKFYSPDIRNEGKKDLISVMNESNTCKSNGKNLLKLFREGFDKRITKISSGMLAIEPNKDIRRTKLQIVASNIQKKGTFALAYLDSTQMGDLIVSHYKRKFRKSIKSDADYTILFMLIGNELYYVDSNGTKPASFEGVFNSAMKIHTVPKLHGLKAKLEVRIQPRKLNSAPAPVFVDVMASFRLSKKPAGARLSI